MAERIDKHRSRRPASWQTVETARNVAAALEHINARVVLLDCLTLLASNLFAAEDLAANAQALSLEIDALLAASVARRGDLIIVSNEVGSGIVPDNALSRAFRDALGAANQQVARAADSVTLLVSGLPLELKVAQ
jgi:adenosylcobinamide kinase/adenosylcobinamide-phosphate guanylyltransferase